MKHCVREKSTEVLDVLVRDVIGQAFGVVRPGLIPKGHEVAMRQCGEALVFGPRVDSLLQQCVDLLLGWENLVAHRA